MSLLESFKESRGAGSFVSVDEVKWIIKTHHTADSERVSSMVDNK